MNKFEILANGTSYGNYVAADKEAALVAHVIDAGYESIADAAERVDQTEEKFRSTFKIEETETWFAIISHGQEARYGYGWKDEAEKYCDMIDTDKVFWHATALTDAEIDDEGLDNPNRGTEGFILPDEIKFMLAEEAESA